MDVQTWRRAMVATAVGVTIAACGSAPRTPGPTGRAAPTPTPTPPIAVGDACAVITEAQVGAILGTPVGAAEREGATCHFSTTSPTAVGNYDPALRPPPNVALHGAAITVAQGSADALSGGRAHFMFKPQPVTIPGADLAFLMDGPHVAVVFAQRGGVAVEVTVFRGWTDDPYLAGQLAGAILPGVPAA